MKVDTYSPNTGEKLYTFALFPIVVENHRVYGAKFLALILDGNLKYAGYTFRF